MQSPGTSWFFTISERPAQDSLVLAAAGRVGSAAAPQLADALVAAGRRSTHVVLDLSGVDYISSAGVRALEHAAAQLSAEGKALVVRGAQGPTRSCLDMARVPHE